MTTITQNQIAIIGGGIAGLTLGLVLKRLNCPFVIYESASIIKPIGAGLILAPNAMQIYNLLGIQNQLVNVGNRVDCMHITDQALRPLNSLDIRPLLKKHQWENLAIHRADLHQVLLKAIGTENVVVGRRLLLLEEDSNRIQLLFEDGTSVQHTAVIGADGINSSVRRFVTKSAKQRKTNQVCWRGILNYTLPLACQKQSYEAWHDGKRFGYVQINSREVYWYFVSLKTHSVTTETIAESLYDFFPLAQELVKLTSVSKIFQSELSDLKILSEWSNENVCLIGDAAHATTPNMGQGACQAIEDAYLIGQLLTEYDTTSAFKLFTKMRINRVNSIVSNSRQIGWIAHWQNKTLEELRNNAMRLVPKWGTLRHFEKLYKVPFLINK